MGPLDPPEQDEEIMPSCIDKYSLEELIQLRSLIFQTFSVRIGILAMLEIIKFLTDMKMEKEYINVFHNCVRIYAYCMTVQNHGSIILLVLILLVKA